MEQSQANPEAERAFREWRQATRSRALSRRTAASSARFLLPHLSAGQRLLDIGCGPGSITVGLAEAVAPGEVIGVDANPSAIDRARELAKERGDANVRFEVANLYDLPFDDGSFDVVFMHFVLQHVPDPQDAVRRAARLVRPGGKLAVADADFGGSIIWPESPAMRRAMRLMIRMRQFEGGDLYVGRKLASLLLGAGLAAVEATATAGANATPAGTIGTGEFWGRYYGAPELQAHAAAMGWATSEQCEEAAKAWRAWGQSPGAYWATFSCQALGRKPG